MTYLFDANTFMEAARLYYRFDVAPGFWEWLVSDPMVEHIASVQAVRDEIASGHGDLVTWAEQVPDAFWIPVSSATLEKGTALAEWATDPDHAYKQAAVDDFLSKADFWLIAEAMASDRAVVTREVPAPESKKVVKIPDVCAAFGVACAQPFPVYAALGLRLTWADSQSAAGSGANDREVRPTFRELVASPCGGRRDRPAPVAVLSPEEAADLTELEAVLRRLG